MNLNQDVIDRTPTENRRKFFNQYERSEESKRIAYHYDEACEFINTVTGGRWNIYSACFFDDTDTLTQAQERKLDKFAQMMHLKPGMRVLDIGCGLGGALTYLCHKYGVTGVGISVTPSQPAYANARAQRIGADARFEVSHWDDFSDGQFDALYSDEMIVHVFDLDVFHRKCYSLLKPNGVALHKELHFTKDEYVGARDNLSSFLNGYFGYTGNYRLLEEEMLSAIQCGFLVEDIHVSPIENYIKIVNEHWLPSLSINKEKLIDLAGERYYKEFIKYLRCYLVLFKKGVFRLHTTAYRKSRG